MQNRSQCSLLGILMITLLSGCNPARYGTKDVSPGSAPIVTGAVLDAEIQQQVLLKELLLKILIL